jgi:hypothetical protein
VSGKARVLKRTPDGPPLTTPPYIRLRGFLVFAVVYRKLAAAPFVVALLVYVLALRHGAPLAPSKPSPGMSNAPVAVPFEMLSWTPTMLALGRAVGRLEPPNGEPVIVTMRRASIDLIANIRAGAAIEGIGTPTPGRKVVLRIPGGPATIAKISALT